MEKKDKVPHINLDYFEDLTGNIKDGKAGEVEEVGTRIRQLRQERGISLEDLSSLTGFDVLRLEDTLVQIDEMCIEHGYDIDRILWLGKQLEKTVGTRLRSEAMINGRTLKEGHMHYARPGLAKLKEKLNEAPDQNFPKI